MRRIPIILLLLLWGTPFVQAQENEALQADPDSTGAVSSSLLPSTVPLLIFDDSREKEDKKSKKKKKRKNIYFGVKTKKKFLRNTIRQQYITEVIHFTDQYRQPDPYIRDIYWYDRAEKSIRKEGFQTNSGGYLLHGPYERKVDDVLVESGMFYFGMKHRTWMLFDAKNVLQDKNHYESGWPRESKVTYYNRSENTIEKITPIQYGLEEGYFFHFHEDHQVAVTGEYQYGQKVGLWTEYWDTNNTKAIRKREIQYQVEPYIDTFRPYIRAEWNKDGNLIYRNSQTNQ